MANVGVKIICSEDCGNAPKKVLIREYLTALAQGDREVLRENVADDLVCDLVGSGRLQGVEDFLRHAVSAPEPWAELQIDTIITHGNTGAASGVITTSGGRRIAFCDVYQFSGFKKAKIKRVASYLISGT